MSILSTIVAIMAAAFVAMLTIVQAIELHDAIERRKTSRKIAKSVVEEILAQLKADGENNEKEG